MKRWLLFSVFTLPLVSLLVCTAVFPTRATNFSEAKRGNAPGDAEPMKVEVKPWGPTQEMLDEASARLAKHAQVRRYLKGTRYRLLSFDLVLPDEKASAELIPPSRYRGTFYDYTNDLTIVAEGSFDRPETVVVTTAATQPLPSNEELDEAAAILKSDPKLGPAILDERVGVYHPMPPLYTPEKSRGRAERIVNVGLMAKDSSDKSVERTNEVVAVNLSRRTVLRFAEGAPPTSRAVNAATCGGSSSGSSTGRGVAGQYLFKINAQDGTKLWSFLAIRPSASSGADASGIELQNVYYRGRLVLKRAHVPILNVQYDSNLCGPYRDWEYAESAFSADPTNGTTVTPGVRSCTIPATTQLDTDVDVGNFQGIAYYTQGDATILVSEMSAGWYRYISEWGFHADGTISPRFGMGATANSCTCNGHHHHAYWRFDFDIDGSSPNRVLESSENSTGGITLKPLPLYIPITTEAKRYRKNLLPYVVDNPVTRHSYQIRPNFNDGTAVTDTYGGGDMWFLNYSATELDDSTVRTGTAANLDAFVNNQPISTGGDLVVWYAIHVGHYHTGAPGVGENSITGELVAGPDLVPMRW
ncbi:MAG: hypothetical protein WCD76_03715 [Pyrinomonadaceae bacterium]